MCAPLNESYTETVKKFPPSEHDEPPQKMGRNKQEKRFSSTDASGCKLHHCLQRKGPPTQKKKDMSELIILAVPSSYSRRPVVWYVATKEVEKMRKTLEDFYYGNIVPCERQMAHGSELKKAADRVAHYES